MKHITLTRTIPAATGLLMAGILLAACGGGGTDTGLAATGGSPLVTATSIPSVGTVLVDGSGHPLYTPAQETDGKIRCAKGCTAVWPPLTLGAGAAVPTVSGVSGTFGTVDRPDGSRQLTLDGHPLYRFSFDKAGAVTGDGKTDSFGGRSFLWHVLRTSGGVASSTPADDGGSGY